MGTNHISFYVLILTKYTRKRKDEYLWQFIQVNIPKWRSHLIRQNRATYSNLENHLFQITEPGNPI